MDEIHRPDKTAAVAHRWPSSAAQPSAFEVVHVKSGTVATIEVSETFPLWEGRHYAGPQAERSDALGMQNSEKKLLLRFTLTLLQCLHARTLPAIGTPTYQAGGDAHVSSVTESASPSSGSGWRDIRRTQRLADTHPVEQATELAPGCVRGDELLAAPRGRVDATAGRVSASQDAARIRPAACRPPSSL
jgi:hypothetical protein